MSGGGSGSNESNSGYRGGGSGGSGSRAARPAAPAAALIARAMAVHLSSDSGGRTRGAANPLGHAADRFFLRQREEKGDQQACKRSRRHTRRHSKREDRSDYNVDDDEP